MAVRVGDIYQSNKEGKYEVIENVGDGRWEVRFIDTGYVTTSQYTKVKRGEIRDHYVPCKFGIGYLGEMAGKTRKSEMTIRSYQTWHNMLVRCYYEPYQNKYPTYKGCSVCEEWLNFDTFNKWFITNYIEGFVLDKDIIKQDNKIYRPEFCSFVTCQQNSEKATEKVRSTYKIFSEEEGELTINNVGKFCKDKGYSQGTFLTMLNGKRNHAWGWKLLEKLED